MKLTNGGSFKALWLLSGNFILFGSPGHAAGPDLWKSGQVLVQPKPGLSDVEFENILRGHNAYAMEAIGSSGIHIVQVPPQAEQAVARALAKNPHIQFAELDKATAPEAIPNDPQFTKAWHLAKIQAPAAWDLAKADGVTIAVLDSGIQADHPDLAGKLLPGWNAVDGSNNIADLTGHGTAVAGAAAAATNNAAGVAGVAWNARILPVRITNQSTGYAYWSDIAKGVDWAGNNGAKVVNISYEVTSSAAITTAAQQLRNKGGLVVVAGGNGGIDPGYADNTAIISVAATSSSDVKASYSNYGAYIDVAAPGDGILTTHWGSAYASWSGTSLATPITAGTIGLIMSANSSLAPGDVEKVLESSADKIGGATGFSTYYGNGRINAANALKLAINTVVRDTSLPTVSLSNPTAGSVVSGLVAVGVNAADNIGVTRVSLYANQQLIGTDTTSPYQFSWDTRTAVDGNVTLTAQASDAAGNIAVSNGVAVIVKNQLDTTPPTVAISQPSNGSQVSGTVTIAVTARDNINISSVKLYIDGILKTTVTSSSLAYSWSTRKIAAGTHSIRAVATDGSGNSAEQLIQVVR